MGLRALHPNVRLRIAVGFVQRLVDSMVTVVMAVYLATRFGALVAGALMVAVMALSVVGALHGGHRAETRGRRPTLLLGETAAALTFVLMAVGQGLHLRAADLGVLAAFAVNKYFAGLAMPANDAMIVDVTTTEDRTLVYTVNYWAVNLALAIGSLVGGFGYGRHFGALLVAAAVGMSLAALSTAALLAETRPATAASPGGSGSGLRAYRAVLADRVFVRFVVAAALVMTLEFQLVNWIGVRLALGLPLQDLPGGLPVDGVRMLGLLRAENTLLVVLLAFALAPLFGRIPRRVRMATGISLFTAGYATYALSSTGTVLLVAGLVLTVGELLDAPARQAVLAEIVPATDRSRYMAVYALHIRVALVAASACISLGPLLTDVGMAALYVVLGAAVLLLYRSVWSVAPATVDTPAAEPACGTALDREAEPARS